MADEDVGERWLCLELLPTEDEAEFGRQLATLDRPQDWKFRAASAFTLGVIVRRLTPMDENFYRNSGQSRQYGWENKEAFAFGYDWTGNKCCRCSRRGRVKETEVSSGAPIEWQCTGCGQFVCIECALTIPGSCPLELYDDTWCSEECRTGAGSK